MRFAALLGQKFPWKDLLSLLSSHPPLSPIPIPVPPHSLLAPVPVWPKGLTPMILFLALKIRFCLHSSPCLLLAKAQYCPRSLGCTTSMSENRQEILRGFKTCKVKRKDNKNKTSCSPSEAGFRGGWAGGIRACCSGFQSRPRLPLRARGDSVSGETSTTRLLRNGAALAVCSLSSREIA